MCVAVDAYLSFEESLTREMAPTVPPQVESPLSPSLLEIPTLEGASPSVLLDTGAPSCSGVPNIDDEEEPGSSSPFVVELSDSLASIPLLSSQSSLGPKVDSYLASPEVTPLPEGEFSNAEEPPSGAGVPLPVAPVF